MISQIGLGIRCRQAQRQARRGFGTCAGCNLDGVLVCQEMHDLCGANSYGGQAKAGNGGTGTGTGVHAPPARDERCAQPASSCRCYGRASSGCLLAAPRWGTAPCESASSGNAPQCAGHRQHISASRRCSPQGCGQKKFKSPRGARPKHARDRVRCWRQL